VGEEQSTVVKATCPDDHEGLEAHIRRLAGDPVPESLIDAFLTSGTYAIDPDSWAYAVENSTAHVMEIGYAEGGVTP